MWIVVGMAHGNEAAEHIKELLDSEGILVRLKPVYKKRGDNNCFQVTVLDSEQAEAREILLENGLA